MSNQATNKVKQQFPAKIAIFASGAGSNAQKIIEAAKDKKADKTLYSVELIFCNKPEAGVLKIAADNQIETVLIEKEKFLNGDAYVDLLKKHDIRLIVLAGFLWQIPPALTDAFTNKIINIHPALLPKFGGKGMYGKRVHEAVLAEKETQSGITIHYVDELYDHGKTIFQATCPVNVSDTPESLAAKIHMLEHAHFPRVINEVLEMQNRR